MSGEHAGWNPSGQVRSRMPDLGLIGNSREVRIRQKPTLFRDRRGGIDDRTQPDRESLAVAPQPDAVLRGPAITHGTPGHVMQVAAWLDSPQSAQADSHVAIGIVDREPIVIAAEDQLGDLAAAHLPALLLIDRDRAAGGDEHARRCGDRCSRYRHDCGWLVVEVDVQERQSERPPGCGVPALMPCDFPNRASSQWRYP
jgi:hypothetical protein